MRAVLILIAAALPCSFELPAQGARAASVTAAGRGMDQALAGALAGVGSSAPEQRGLMLLIDPTPSLVQAGFAEALARCLDRYRQRLSKVEFGLMVVGAKAPVLPLGANALQLHSAVRQVLARPQAQIKNVYKSLREALQQLPARSGAREILLVSLENGDAEDEVEGTLQALRRAKVVLRSICSESFLSDSYWVSRGAGHAPRGTVLRGGDGAFVELPYGWAFQQTTANEIAPATTAVWGISRLVAGTKGRAHLYAPAPTTAHNCAIYGSCLFCNGREHDPKVDAYWKSRVELFTASTGSRADVLLAAGQDPCYRLVLEAWQKAGKARLINSSPTVRRVGARLQLQRPRGARGMSLAGIRFKSLSRDAKKAAYAAAQILSGLRRKLAALPADQGIPRYRAMAEFTLLMLQVTRINMLQLHFFCEEVGPGLVARKPQPFPPPELDPVQQRERRPSGLSYTNFCLCHGAQPFEEIALPGGEATRQELGRLQTMIDAFELKYGHTPFAFGLRKSGIARFHLVYPGIVGKRPRRRPRSGDDKGPTTERGRPSRAGGSSGGTGGPTTGR